MSYRDDPRWQETQANYLADRPDLSPDDRFTERIQAAWQMRAVEREHEAA